jgi:hypothetical protein
MVLVVHHEMAKCLHVYRLRHFYTRTLQPILNSSLGTSSDLLHVFESLYVRAIAFPLLTS